MCGITGILNFNGEPVSEKILKLMTDSISHRGPDGEGFFTDSFLGMGHRRLSIIDLTDAGKQPMESSDGRFVISYNGEVYNFLELRKDLEKLNYKFKSDTDSEVVLYSWVEWREKCVHKFNGMFAFSVWDKKEKTLHLVRDRYGIKPLYYALFQNTFLFGSEQKAILQHPISEKEIDKKALVEYFTFQNIFTDRTLLENVKLLPQGSIGKIKFDKPSEININKYWDYNFREPNSQLSLREYQEELDRLLKQAVKRQLVSDVELGSYLSGGMDSGTIVALASRQLPYIKTFTCGFDLTSASGIELGFDERKRAESLSAIYKSEHYQIVLKSGDMERCLADFSYHLEEPRVGQSYPNFYVAKLASKFVKVILSGAGGDELFGGYPWRYYRGASSKNFEEFIDNYYVYWQRLIDNKDIKKVFQPIWSDVSDVWTRDIFRDVFSNNRIDINTPEDFVNSSLYFEAKTFLHGLLVVEDKLSMAHSMETRLPFLDNDLVDFAMQCPLKYKINNLSETIRLDENLAGKKERIYYKKTNDGKKILRDVMRKYVPNDIVDAAKKGFSSPDASWFKGESIDFVTQRLINNDSMIYNFLDKNHISNLISEHLDGKENKRLLIWSLLNFDEYLNNQYN